MTNKAYLISEETLRQVLETLPTGHYYCEDVWYCCPAHEEALSERKGECECGFDEAKSVIETLRTILASPPKEPVAWVISYDDNCDLKGWIDCKAWSEDEFTKPLFAYPAPAVPDGWQLVPKEPTDEMLDVFTGSDFTAPFNPKAKSLRVGAYKAMLAAASKPEDGKCA